MSKYLTDLREKVGHALLMVPGVAAIIRNEQGHVLFQRRRDNGQWSLPAGAIDPDETPAEAVVREVYEETGLHVVPERLLGVTGGKPYTVTYPNGDVTQYTIIVFACKVVGGDLGGMDDETECLEYFPPGRLPPRAVRLADEFFDPSLAQPIF